MSNEMQGSIGPLIEEYMLFLLEGDLAGVVECHATGDLYPAFTANAIEQSEAWIKDKLGREGYNKLSDILKELN